MKYTIKTDQTHGNVLFIDDRESICPFRPAIALPVQNSFQQMQMQIVSFPCCTNCPHAVLEKFGIQDAQTYTVNCTGVVQELTIE